MQIASHEGLWAHAMSVAMRCDKLLNGEDAATRRAEAQQIDAANVISVKDAMEALDAAEAAAEGVSRG